MYIAALKGIPKKVAKKRVTELLEVVDLSHVANKKVKTFSGGMKQRVGIAQALLNNPKILILDDSTSAVDTKTDALIRQAFAEKIPDTTKLIIAQRISSVMDADLIVVLDDGRVAGIGTHQQLMSTCETYREICLSQLSSEEVGA